MEETMFKSQPLLVHWRILDACNYHCDYCIANNIDDIIIQRRGDLSQMQKEIALKERTRFTKERDLLKSKISKEGKRFIAQKIVEYIKKSRRKVIVTLTGGEIFLEKQLIEIFNHLAPHCDVILDTNLSLFERIKDFLQSVDIKKIQLLYISFHPTEILEKKKLDEFIEMVKLLKSTQLKYLIHYIYHPKITEKYHKLIYGLNANGIEIMPKPFVGQYNDKFYPEDYTQEERKKIVGIEERYIQNFPKKISTNVTCVGGKDMIQIDPIGMIYRCYSCWIPHSTVLDGIKPFLFKKKCPVDYCFY